MTERRNPPDDQNPLLADWTGAFGLPPFGAITPEHFRPAFDPALAAHRAEIDAIAANPAAPSFDNTIEALETSGRALDRVANVFFVLAGADTGDAIEAVERDISPLLARHSNALYLDRALYARIAELYRPARRARPYRRAGARARPLPHPLRAGRRRAREAGAGSARGDQRAAGEPRHPVRAERAGRREGLRAACWRRAISPACRISPAPPRARRPRSAATPANTPSRWRARRARASCSSPPAATCARRSSRPGSSAARTAARPTTARSSPRWSRLRAERAKLLGLCDLRRLPARRPDGQDAAGGAQAARRGLGPRPREGRRRARRAAGDDRGGGRQFRARAVGLALLRREAAQGALRSRRGRDQAVLPARQDDRGRLRDRAPPVRPDLHAGQTCRSITRTRAPAR